MEALKPLLQIFAYAFIGGIVFTFIKSFFKKPSSWLVDLVINFLGSLFIFSGAVKAIDPLGTSYKMKDYFNAFSQFTGLSFDFFANMSTSLAVIMIVLEIVLGVALIMGFKKKWALGLSAFIMIFFTILTGFTYLTGFINPEYYDITTRHEMQAAGNELPIFVEYDTLQMKVTDCGCFGDFLKLDPKISFFKDIFLMFVLIFLAWNHKHIKPLFGDFFSWIKVGGSTVFFTLFCFYNFVWNLPLVDFRPYKIGNDINALRIEIPDKLEYGFIFENLQTGETKRVTMDDYAAVKADPNWKFTDEQDNVVLEKGVPATIANFAAFDTNGFDVTEDILLNENYSFWVLSKKLEESDLDTWADLNQISTYANENDLKMFAFMTASFEDAELFRHENQIDYTFYQADETFIKTVVRANPGLVLLKNGIVKGKWHHNHIPSKEEIAAYIKGLE